MKSLIEKQSQFFNQHKTYDVSFRIQQLKRLQEALKKYETRLNDALMADLKKSEFESYVSEIGLVYEEIRLAIKYVRKWAKPQKLRAPLVHFYSQTWLHPEPLGRVLIIAPWNYPVLLLFSPAIGAIAAGNCVVLKPSELTPNVSKVMTQMVAEFFDPAYMACVEGGVAETQELLSQKFDHVFFTGSTGVGRVVMQAAAKTLTPVTLELGGKSPCIVDETANIGLSAKRIAWGKFFNAGQTCVAPDYILVHPSVKKELTQKIMSYVESFYGKDPAQSEDYGKIVNSKHFERLQKYLSDGKVVLGGKTNPQTRYFSPTLLDNVSETSAVMQEEIFGPILPILEYKSFESAFEFVQKRPKPLALYFFSTNSERVKKVTERLSFGGGCINDTLIHLSCSNLPFGGVGESGLGAYHGKYSFDAFTHYKSVLKRSFLIDVSLRYPAYKGKLGLIRKLIG